MRQRGRRTKGMEEAHPFAGMSQVNPHAAGIDIGAEEIVVCLDVSSCLAQHKGAGVTQDMRSYRFFDTSTFSRFCDHVLH